MYNIHHRKKACYARDWGMFLCLWNKANLLVKYFLHIHQREPPKSFIIHSPLRFNPKRYTANLSQKNREMTATTQVKWSFTTSVMIFLQSDKSTDENKRWNIHPSSSSPFITHTFTHKSLSHTYSSITATVLHLSGCCSAHHTGINHVSMTQTHQITF